MTAPRTLTERALEALEWSLIQDALSSRTRSPLGGGLASRHTPFPTPAASRRLRERVLEGRGLLESSPIHSYVAGARDVTEPLDRVSRDGVLDPAEIWACGHFLSTLGLIGEELRARKETAPLWAADFQLAPRTPPVCDRISRSVTSEGVILDSASPELARLRRERHEKRIEFEATLENRVKDWYSRGLLQDKFYDQVDGRYVVPVKAGEHTRLEGTLVSRSNTGQSFFIEPADLTASNNKLKEVDLAIRSEEFRILRSLSAELGSMSATYLVWVEPVGELDLALAAALLAKDWELEEPLVSENDGPLKLTEVFHPGLKLRAIDIVRNSFELEACGRGLLISGPNTGGKTVLLKAAALSSCMARAGLLVPAAQGSHFPHYADVLAFIGDEQNLAAGLSSFSAQIMDLKAVLADTRKPLLIVIDEILSSTDPEEASALAQALIEELVERGHHVVVTSHFSELSLRSKVNPRLTVAAMEFDEGQPTYRLRLDELGSSHAIEIADRLGFPKRLLERARQLMSTAKLDYDKAMGELKQKEAALRLELERSHLAMEREKESYKNELRSKFDEFMAQARASMEQTVESLSQRISSYTRQGLGGSAASAEKAAGRLEAAAKDALASLEQGAKAVAGALGKGAAPEPVKYPLEEGVSVKVKSMRNAQGTVLKVTGTGAAQTATVQVGNFRLERPADDLTVLPPKRATPTLSGYVGIDGPTLLTRKLDVRGRRYDDALGECERFIDQAFRSGASSVTVVTGHGTGALKKGLKELLGGLPYVREFRPEREGDDGATLIEFER